jgi:hypothetical protein
VRVLSNAMTKIELIEAWQYLIETSLAWSLQGSFGRFARDLIDQGICSTNQLIHETRSTIKRSVSRLTS